MQSSVLSVVFLPLALAVIMAGLGLTLTIADFQRVLVYPRAIFVGLLCQSVLLPIVALGLAHAFSLPPELAVGLMLIAAAPGGATANLYSHLAEGDVALNLTLTATNSVLSVVTLPLIVNFSLAHFMGADKSIPLQFDKVMQVFAIVLIPTGIGMLVRARTPELAARLQRPVRIVSAVFLLLVIVAAILKDRASLGGAFRDVGLPALLFNLLSLATGWIVPRLVRLPVKQAIAISMEIGIHNGTLAIAVASSPLLLNSATMAIPPAVYSLIMFFTAGALASVLRRRAAAETATSAGR